jgi:hypothetical protein
MSKSDKRTGLVTILLVAGGLAAASLGLGAGAASADPGGGGLTDIIGGSGGSGDAGGVLSNVGELQPIIDAVREDPRGTLNDVLKNPGDLIGLLGG